MQGGRKRARGIPTDSGELNKRDRTEENEENEDDAKAEAMDAGEDNSGSESDATEPDVAKLFAAPDDPNDPFIQRFVKQIVTQVDPTSNATPPQVARHENLCDYKVHSTPVPHEQFSCGQVKAPLISELYTARGIKGSDMVEGDPERKIGPVARLLHPLQEQLLPYFLSYHDVLFCREGAKSMPDLRQLCALHIVNHLLKSGTVSKLSSTVICQVPRADPCPQCSDCP